MRLDGLDRNTAMSTAGSGRFPPGRRSDSESGRGPGTGGGDGGEIKEEEEQGQPSPLSWED
jgi:hypothetical protein